MIENSICTEFLTAPKEGMFYGFLLISLSLESKDVLIP